MPDRLDEAKLAADLRELATLVEREIGTSPRRKRRWWWLHTIPVVITAVVVAYVVPQVQTWVEPPPLSYSRLEAPEGGRAGQPLLLSGERCNRLSHATPVVSKHTLVNIDTGDTYPLPDSSASAPPGCVTINRVGVVIPDRVPTGWYRVESHVVVSGDYRAFVQVVTTAPFLVLAKEPI